MENINTGIDLSPQTLKKIDIAENKIAFFSQLSQEFEAILQAFECCENHTITNSLRAEEMHLKAKDKSHEIRAFGVQFKNFQKKIKEDSDLFFLQEGLREIEKSFEKPGTRVQEIYTKKQLNKVLHTSDKVIPVNRRINNSSRKSVDSFIGRRMKS